MSPGQQAYEVLPPSGATAAGTPYAGDPGSVGPVTPSATPELPPGGVATTTTTEPGATPAAAHAHAAAPRPDLDVIGRIRLAHGARTRILALTPESEARRPPKPTSPPSRSSWVETREASSPWWSATRRVARW